MKFVIASILTVFTFNSFAQGPMPPCVRHAQEAALSAARNDYAHDQFDTLGLSISYQDANEISWQIQFRDLTTAVLIQYRVVIAKADCQILEVGPASSVVSSSPQASSERAQRCRESSLSGCEYSKCMGTYRGMCK
jgi:hypothetical protein